MLTITVPPKEHWDSEKQEFLYLEELELHLEHSLVTLSKWEMIHKKPYLSPGDKTEEEAASYVLCMIQDESYPDDIIGRLTQENVDAITEYINDSQTGTTFPNERKRPQRQQEIFSAELIYHWMIEYSIPMECQYWHLNRLFTLMKVREVKLADPKKQTNGSEGIAAQRRAENERRRRELGTTG